MKLSQYAKKVGVTEKTAWRWYKAGTLDAYQTPTGMVIVRAHVRQEALHQATTTVVTKATSQHARCVVIEDLHVSGMLKNRKLARAIADVGLSEFRRQLTYKAEAVGLPVKVVSRWYPSSKMCSRCGWIDEQQTLADRTFVCQVCGLVLGRDFNAAWNLAASG